ncbi:tyrosine-type recombinase/integrase [Leptothrix sp. BB-4]
MSTLIDRHEVDDGLHIYLQANSRVWIARFKVGGRWLSRTTKQRDRAKAITAAVRVRAECEIKHEHGIAIQTKAFRDVAKLAIERMKQLPSNVRGAGSVKDHEWALLKYHIPFFDRTYITSIDRQKLAEFDAWRIEQLGRTPAQSTLKTHNVALHKVFDEAVLRKWMTPGQVPVLSSSGGVAATRRDYFTAEEIEKIRNAFPEWIDEGRTSQTRSIRELLYYYFNVAVLTGLRPGTEMDNLRWNDIAIKEDHVVITVRKGKTTLYTGSRHVVGNSTVHEMILDMHGKSTEWIGNEDNVPDDWNPLVFRLSDGSTCDTLGRNFTTLLRRLKLDSGSGGKRTLYSLRHTYITHMLLDRTPASLIAKQCGTSTAMIEAHYSHITPLMYTKELSGNEGAAMASLITKYADI